MRPWIVPPAGANPPTTEDAVDSWRERWLSIQYTLDGIRAHLNADLPGSEMGLVESAIRGRADRIPPNPESGIFDPYPQRMADGLVELCSTTGDENGSLRPKSWFTPISKH